MHRHATTRAAAQATARYMWVRAFAVVAFAIGSAPMVATAGTTLLIEGRLANGAGAGVSDGNYGLTFALYSGETAKTAFWQEKGVLLAVKGGWFHYALGSKSPLNPATLAGQPTAWLGVSIGAEAELTRQPLRSVTSALVAATTSALQCSGCVTPAAMKFTDNIDLGAFGLKAKAVNASTVTASTVQAQVFIGDGSKLSGLKLPAGACASGKVLVGINADGSIKCATTAASLPPDGLDEISNGVMKNQFAETFAIPAADVNKAIPDATGVDLVSTIKVPNIGTTEQFFKVTVDLQNSDLSQLSIVLLPPNDKKTGMTLCDPCGKKYEKVLKTAFPTPQALKTGDLKPWIGKNPAGTWNLKITDAQFCVPQLDKVNCDVTNVTDGKLNFWAISTQVLSNSKVQVTGDLLLTGKLILTNPPVAEPNPIFPAGSTPFLYGSMQDRMGGNYIYGPKYTYGSSVPTTSAGLHAATQRIMYADAYGNLVQQLGGSSYYTYDASQQVLVAFIKNTTSNPIKQTLYFRYSSRSSAANYAGLALNGAAVWTYTSNNTSTASVAVTFPKNQTSVLVLKCGASQHNTYGYNYFYRSVIGFYNNSFKLPTGLAFDYDRYSAWLAGK